jgi:hypothetical protein
MEIWKDIPGYEGRYQVSDQGRIKSLARMVPYERWGEGEKLIKERIRKPHPGRHGYLSLIVKGLDRKARTIKVHLAVLEAFVGPRPSGMHGCHGPGGQQDNRLVNLRWDTAKANNADKVRDGTHQVGERNPAAKLTAPQVLELRTKLASKTLKALAEEYGISIATVHNIKTRRIWAHV